MHCTLILWCFFYLGGLAGIAGMAAARKVSPLAPGAKTPAKGSLAGVASKLGGATAKKKGGSLASRLSKMGQGSSFGPASSTMVIIQGRSHAFESEGVQSP